MKRLIFLNVIITAIVTLGMNMILSSLSRPQRIVTADFEAMRSILVESAVSAISSIKSDSDVDAKAHIDRIDKFQKAVAELSKKKNVVILDKRAVLGVATDDVTGDLKQMIEDLN